MVRLRNWVIEPVSSRWRMFLISEDSTRFNKVVQLQKTSKGPAVSSQRGARCAAELSLTPFSSSIKLSVHRLLHYNLPYPLKSHQFPSPWKLAYKSADQLSVPLPRSPRRRRRHSSVSLPPLLGAKSAKVHSSNFLCRSHFTVLLSALSPLPDVHRLANPSKARSGDNGQVRLPANGDKWTPYW